MNGKKAVNYIFSAVFTLWTAGMVLSGNASGQALNINDKKKIIEWSRAEEHTLALSGLFYDDLFFQDYVSEIGDRLKKHIPGAEEFNFNFHTLRNPFLNAFAMATGAIYVHTGLIARLENEAQLSAVIAHEMTHTLKQHPVLGYTHSKSQIAGYQLLSLGTSIAITLIGGRGTGAYIGDQFAQMGLVLMTSASMSGYSREMEEEADLGSLKWMIEAGYDPTEVPKIFELFLKEYGDSGRLENYFWGDHPRNTTRMKYINKEIRRRYPDGKPSGGFVGKENYQVRTNLLLRNDALLNIQAGMFHIALAELDTFLLRNSDDPTAIYYKGLAFQSMSQNPDTLAMAKEMLNRSIELDSSYAKPHRMLGYIAEEDSLAVEAVSSYEKYLALQPDAKDRLYIRWKIGQLQESLEKPRKEPKGGGQ